MPHDDDVPIDIVPAPRFSKPVLTVSPFAGCDSSTTVRIVIVEIIFLEKIDLLNIALTPRQLASDYQTHLSSRYPQQFQ